MPEMPEAWADLIKALTIMSRHPTSKTRVTGCGHDTLYVCADDSKFTADEIDELEELHFLVHPEGGFYSFQFGSC